MPSSSAPSPSERTPTPNDRQRLEEYFRGEFDAIGDAMTQAIRSGSQEAAEDTLRSALEKMNVLFIKVTNAQSGETIKLGVEVIYLAKALRRSSKVVAFA